jgi:hypothetical protein
MARQLPRKPASTAPVPVDKKPDDGHQQEQTSRLEQRLNDPEWRPLAELVRKKLGEQFSLHWGEVHFLNYGTRNPCPLPYWVTFTVPQLLAVLSRHGPEVARLLLDEVLDDRHAKPVGSKIPADLRTIPLSMKDAAKLMGYGGNRSGVKKLRAAMDARAVMWERHTRQSFVFDRVDFPRENWSEVVPTGPN